MHVPSNTRRRPKSDKVPSFLVLPHHAVWESARLERVLAQASSKYSIVSPDGHDVCNTRVSWKRSASNLSEMMRASCDVRDPSHKHNIVMLS